MAAEALTLELRKRFEQILTRPESEDRHGGDSAPFLFNQDVPAHQLCLGSTVDLMSGHFETRHLWLDFLRSPWRGAEQAFSRVFGLMHVLPAMATHLWARTHQDQELEDAAHRWLRTVFAVYALSAVRGGDYGWTVTATGGSSWHRPETTVQREPRQNRLPLQREPFDAASVSHPSLDSVVSAALSHHRPLIAGRWESACIQAMQCRFGVSPFDFRGGDFWALLPILEDLAPPQSADLSAVERLLAPLRLEFPLIIQRRTEGTASFCEWTPCVNSGTSVFMQALAGWNTDSRIQYHALVLNDGAQSGGAAAETWIEKETIWARFVGGAQPQDPGLFGLKQGNQCGILLPKGDLLLTARLDPYGGRLMPARTPAE